MGVPADPVKAYMWTSIAQAQGSENAKNNLLELQKNMTPAQITKAQTLANDWWQPYFFKREATRAVEELLGIGD